MFDVLVVGGGPVGACAAALLARAPSNGAAGHQSLRVALLAPRSVSAPAPNAPLEARVVAISRASERILRAAGAWDRVMGPRLCPYERMRVWHQSVAPRSDEELVFDAAEAGQPNLGFIVESRLLQAALVAAFQDSGGRVEPSELSGVEIGAEHVRVATSAGAFSARLVVGADGAQSAVRAAVGMTAELAGYQQTAIVANVATEREHERTAWQRFLSNGTLAFLPLADGMSSIVWSADDPLGARLLSCSDADFARELDDASDRVLGRTRLVSERFSFPLRRLAAHRYTAQRIALIGDAAHVVHPLAGQGVNLGLLDAAALAQLVLEARHEGEDPGALRVLRRYERWRKSEVSVMSTAIEAFDRFLAHGSGPVSRLAQRGLGWVNRSAELKRLFITRALGLSGEPPRFARPSAVAPD